MSIWLWLVDVITEHNLMVRPNDHTCIFGSRAQQSVNCFLIFNMVFMPKGGLKEPHLCLWLLLTMLALALVFYLTLILALTLALADLTVVCI